MEFREICELVKQDQPLPRCVCDKDRLIYHYLAAELQRHRQRLITREQLAEEHRWLKDCSERVDRVYELALAPGKIRAALGGLSKEAVETDNRLALKILAILDGGFRDVE